MVKLRGLLCKYECVRGGLRIETTFPAQYFHFFFSWLLLTSVCFFLFHRNNGSCLFCSLLAPRAYPAIKAKLCTIPEFWCRFCVCVCKLMNEKNETRRNWMESFEQWRAAYIISIVAVVGGSNQFYQDPHRQWMENQYRVRYKPENNEMVTWRRWWMMIMMMMMPPGCWLFCSFSLSTSLLHGGLTMKKIIHRLQNLEIDKVLRGDFNFVEEGVIYILNIYTYIEVKLGRMK